VPARSRVSAAIASVVAVVSAVVIVVMVIRWTDGDGRAPTPLGLERSAAVAPFAGYPEVRAAVDGTCVRLVVADTDARRSDGLRGADDLGPYAGMLFAEDGDGDGAFTMAGVDRPLDITWFAADGSPLDSARMTACPDRGEADCPVYRSDRAYRFALETPGDGSPAGSIAPCAS
jgi:uncharacterized membrane protein (UPF0127 family)